METNMINKIFRLFTAIMLVGALQVAYGEGVPTVDFSADQTSGCEPLTVTFTDLTTYSVPSGPPLPPSPDNYDWNFGPGASPATATGAGPHVVTYATAGTRTVSLSVTNLDGSDSETKTNYITVYATPSITLTATDPSYPNGTNGSISLSPAGASYNWTGPAGFSSASQNISGLEAGTYSVTFTDANGCTTNASALLTDPPVGVPTLSEWGLILFTLLLLSYGSIAVLARQTAIAGIGNLNITGVNIPFAKQLFFNMLKVIVPVAILGFVAVHFIIGTNGMLDLTGTIVSSIVVAYIAHIITAYTKSAQ